MAGSGHRRSTRLLSLEDTRVAKQTIVEDYEAFFENDEILDRAVGPLPEHGPEPGSTKKARKRRMRSVDEVLEDNSVKSMEVLVKEVESDQAVKNQESGNCSRRTGQPSASQMPEKRLLKLLIDILQKRDSHNIFAKPVDPMEVKGYYDIVKNPMDFFTLKGNLDQGLYKSLEEFEHDVFLIFKNAMHFNDAATIYYKQARAIQGLATKVFHTLRTDPENFELEYSLARRRPGRKPKSGATTSNSTIPHASNGCIKVRGSNNTSGAGPRSTYRPWESFQTENESLVSEISNCFKPLIPVNFRAGQYRESLMRFAEGLGPIAQMVAKRKLQQLETSEITPPNSTGIPSSSNVTSAGARLDIRGASRGKTSDDVAVEGESYLSMMVDARISNAQASSSKDKNSGSSSSPFQAKAMRASSSSQIPRFSEAGMESQPKGMVAWEGSNNRVQESSAPSLASIQSLPGQNRVSSQSYASNILPQAGPVTEQRRRRSLVLPTIEVYQRTPSDLSYGASSSRTVPSQERNHPWTSSYLNSSQPRSPLEGSLWGSQFVDMNPLARLATPSTSLLQSNSSLGWNQHQLWGAQPATPSTSTLQPSLSSAWNQHQVWGAEPATPRTTMLEPNSSLSPSQHQQLGAQLSNNNEFYLQPHGSAVVNDVAQSRLSRLGPASSGAMPLQLFGRNMVQNQNPGDNQEPDLSLQL